MDHFFFVRVLTKNFGLNESFLVKIYKRKCPSLNPFIENSINNFLKMFLKPFSRNFIKI